MADVTGKSRYPGLFIWTREGRKLEVRVPQNYLLVQAGKQIEYLTGGHVLAGFHEVVATREALDLAAERKKKGESPWRISSTCFGHIQSDQLLEPLMGSTLPTPIDDQDDQSSLELHARFPPILAGEQVRRELQAIALDRS